MFLPLIFFLIIVAIKSLLACLLTHSSGLPAQRDLHSLQALVLSNYFPFGSGSLVCFVTTKISKKYIKLR